MKLKFLVDTSGSENGKVTKEFKKGEVHEVGEKLAKVFLKAKCPVTGKVFAEKTTDLTEAEKLEASDKDGSKAVKEATKKLEAAKDAVKKVEKEVSKAMDASKAKKAAIDAKAKKEEKVVNHKKKEDK